MGAFGNNKKKMAQKKNLFVFEIYVLKSMNSIYFYIKVKNKKNFNMLETCSFIDSFAPE